MCISVFLFTVSAGDAGDSCGFKSSTCCKKPYYQAHIELNKKICNTNLENSKE